MSRVVLGADVCAAGWVVVRLVDGVLDDVEVVDELAELVLPDEVVAPLAVGIDIPIGLIDGADRDADTAARRLLPGRASSVFSTPPRAVVEGWRAGELTTHRQANDAAVAANGKGVSQQAWRLVPRIAEADELAAAAAPRDGARVGVGAGRPPAVLEVHPEVAFTIVVGEPLPRKRSWPGVTTRRAVLARLGVELPDRFPGDEQAAPDDVLDAAVCAWVADGQGAGAGLLRVPEATDQHDHGRPIAIHARLPDPPGVHS